MPIYEFYCPKNNRIYSFFARSLAYAKKTPRCPENAKWKMEKLISGFAITGRAKEKKEVPGGDAADDPRMEKMMAEMEREFSGLGDNDDPDPKMLARAMRKMAEMTGEKTPAVMEEMLGRMEKGEDPEKLEAEYGSALEDFPEPDPGEGAGESVKAALRRLRGQPKRDATLYEMSEYCD